MPKVKWDPTIFRNNEVVLSPSQIDAHVTCNRLRWWNKERKMPGKPQGRQFTYGTVLHGVWERWLLAGNNGRDKEGQLVDIFPPGWESADGFRISPAEAAQIRRLTDDAIERGVLRRLVDRKIEVALDMQVLANVAMIGVIDQLGVGVIEDHKTTSSRKWALSKAKLKKDTKMLCYAAWYFETHPDEESVLLRLNYACKDQKIKVPTWEVEVRVTRLEVSHFWDETCDAAQDVVDLHRLRLSDEEFETVEGPAQKSACQAYGGCDYQAICSKQITPATARAAGKLRDKNQKKKAAVKARGTKEMGVFGKKKSKAPAPASKPQAAPAKETGGPDIPGKEIPPWAVATCNACKGTGVNSEGLPCRACDVVSGRTGGRTSSEFRVWYAEDESIRWAESEGSAKVEGPEVAETKAKPAEKPAPAKPAAKPKKAKKKAAKKKTSPKPAKAPEAKEDTVPATRTPISDQKTQTVVVVNNSLDLPKSLAEAPGDFGNPDTLPTNVGPRPQSHRKPEGFTLFVGCMPLEGETIDLAKIFYVESQELAAAQDTASYFELNAFERRDALAAQIATTAEGLAGAQVILMDRSPSPDLKAFVDALRPFAAKTVVAV